MAQTHHPAPPDCGGRFEIQSFLGAGGMGAVYEAWDRRRHSQVAIKVMQDATARWIYRLKKEFRSLAGIVHPNLVTLHELIEWEDRWLFTMERVPGASFGRAPLSPSSEIFLIGDTLRQLCDGLDFLHGLGLAHGDVKPENVLVTPEGRVVILDFGILRDCRVDEGHDSQQIYGTPRYLAPERLFGGTPEPASDMFAVGVMLFEVLTGRDLDRRAAPESLAGAFAKPPETAEAAGQRGVIEELCLRLLAPEPADRPTAAEVRDAIVAQAPPAARKAASRRAAGPPALPFVAREAELEAVRNALLDRRPEASRVVVVSGESGIGKSELMRRVVDEQLPRSCAVLEGKCYEREQVAFRALDRLVDSLSSKLLEAEPERIQALAWADLAVASRMFPILRRVPEIDRLCEKSPPSDARDPREQRRAAAGILARLLALVAGGRRLVLYVDDLHWGDEESGSVLRDLLQAATDLDACLVGCHRAPVAGSGFLSALLGGDPPLRHADIRVGALPPEPSRDLARALLGPRADPEQVRRVAAEGNGNPFLIRELVQFGAGRDADELALRSAVARHVELLPRAARSILEVLAVSGRRLHVDLAQDATASGETFHASVLLLRSQHLIAASDPDGEQIEPYHDRIREVILQELAPEILAARHADLARALEALGDPDPATLGFHLEGAGEPLRAVEQLLRAARAAESSLAPIQAAAHYAKVVELTQEGDPRHRLALAAQARNLSAAGRAASAGPIYMELAESAGPQEALVLRRSAGEAWVYAGEFDRAHAALRSVFEAAGIREPRTLPGVVWGIARHRLWLWRRRYRYTPLPESEVAPERLLRIDAYGSAAELSSTIDLPRAILAHALQVRESLSAGEPRRVAGALVESVVAEGIHGERSSRRGLELLRIAAEASRMGDFPEERALIRYAGAVHSLLNGRYADVVATTGDLADAPDLRRSGRQLRTLRSILGYARWWLGQWHTMAREYRAWLLDAAERGDQVTTCTFRLEQCGQWANVLADEPEAAVEQVERTLASPIGQELSFAHLAARQTRAWVALYMGHAEEAERVLRLRGAEKAYLQIQRSRVEIAVLHAYAALARGRPGLRGAGKWMRRIDREELAWPEPIVRLIAASMAEREGRREESISGLELAIPQCDRLGYAMFSAAASWRLGQLLGGAEGERLRSAAEEAIAKQGARRPVRIVRTLAPGFGDSL